MTAEYYVGVDVGGTLLRAALGDGHGKIVHRADADTPREQGVEAIVDRIAALVEEAMGSQRSQVKAIALGVPGPVNPKTGILYEPPNLAKADIPMKAMMEQRLNMTVHVANDANVAAIGEWLFGGHGKTLHLFYITVSTGVGGGIISDGQVLDGFNHTAGEIGHTVIDPDGPLCACGNHGCVEAFCSGTNIARAAREVLRAGNSSAMLDLAGGVIDNVTAKHVVAAAQEGDAVASRVFFDAADHLGIAVVNVIHLFSPEIIVIGGGVSQAGDLLFRPVLDRIARTAMKYPARNVKVVPPGLGVDSGLVGAIGLAMMESKKAGQAGQVIGQEVATE